MENNIKNMDEYNNLVDERIRKKNIIVIVAVCSVAIILILLLAMNKELMPSPSPGCSEHEPKYYYDGNGILFKIDYGESCSGYGIKSVNSFFDSNGNLIRERYIMFGPPTEIHTGTSDCYMVSGAGTTAANGLYYLNGTGLYGKSKYVKDNIYSLAWEPYSWNIYHGSYINYQVSDSYDNLPPSSGWIIHGGGVSPAPTVTRCDLNFALEACSEGDTRDYTCSNGKVIPWCECSNGNWMCVNSPENRCTYVPQNPPAESSSAGSCNGQNNAAGQTMTNACNTGGDYIIRVTMANYGGNCGAGLDVTSQVAGVCDGSSSCQYRCSEGNFGSDPAYGCAKGCLVNYYCDYIGNGNPTEAPPAGGGVSADPATETCGSGGCGGNMINLDCSPYSPQVMGSPPTTGNVVADNCAGEGEIAFTGNPTTSKSCCSGLQSFALGSNGIEGAGSSCYNPSKGQPVCQSTGTGDIHLLSTGWYYSGTGDLIRSGACTVIPPVVPKESVKYYYDVTYGYDNENRLIAYNSPIEKEYLSYDDRDNIISRTVNGKTTSYEYDTNNNVVKQIENGVVTTYAYDENGKVTCVNCGGDASNNPEFYSYDGDGNVLDYSDAGGILHQTFNSDGQLTSKSDDNGNSASYSYDSEGGAEISDNGYFGQDLEYNKCGLTINRTYDNNCNLLEDENYQYSYDINNNVLSMVDKQTGDGIYYTYDDKNRVLSMSYAGGNIINYAYGGGEIYRVTTTNSSGDSEESYLSPFDYQTFYDNPQLISKLKLCTNETCGEIFTNWECDDNIKNGFEEGIDCGLSCWKGCSGPEISLNITNPVDLSGNSFMQGSSFGVSVNATCLNTDCGNISVGLDPTDDSYNPTIHIAYLGMAPGVSSFNGAPVLEMDIRSCLRVGGSWSCGNIEGGFTGGSLGNPQLSLWLDSNNKDYLTHYGGIRNEYLRYCNDVNVSWKCEIADDGGKTSGFTGAKSSIVVDSRGIVHAVSGNDGGSVDVSKLRYCNNAGGKWNCRNLFNASASATSMGIDSHDALYFIYVDNSEGLIYCNNTNGEFSCEKVRTGGTGVGSDSISLAIDSNDFAHISYIQYGAELTHCSNSKGNWICEGVVSLSNSYGDSYDPYNFYNRLWNSIATDGDGNAWIAVHNGSISNGLIICNNKENSWSCENINVDSRIFGPGILGYHNSIAVDAKDVVHVSSYYANAAVDFNAPIGYSSSPTQTLTYCNNKNNNWSCERVNYFNSSYSGSDMQTSIFIEGMKTRSNFGKGGLIPEKKTSSAFYTTSKNPQVISLKKDESQVVNWDVNVVGNPSDKKYKFFVFANLENSTNFFYSGFWNVSINRNPAIVPFVGCGDKRCNNGETCGSCPIDCGKCVVPILCGDGTCSITENCLNCELDCGSCRNAVINCGDGFCGGGYENCVTCPLDCWSNCPVTKCGNNLCEEDCVTCPQDCGKCNGCGNLGCEVDLGETHVNCPNDCKCGDSVCDPSESCSSCAQDCGECPAGCTGNWNCGAWSSCFNDLEMRTCTDLNSCGTTTNRPDLTRPCNSSCTESWNCGAWSSCSNNLQTRTCSDSNNCGTTTNKPNETKPCTVSYTLTVSNTLTNSTTTVGTIVAGTTISTTSPTQANINCGSSGSICSVSYNSGTIVTLTATPNSGYDFNRWSVYFGIESCPGTGSCTITMNQNKQVTARFNQVTQVTQYSLTTSSNPSNGGVAQPVGTTNYNAGAGVTITAWPNAGYHFVDWSGDCSGTSSTCTLIMNSNKITTATFASDTITCTPSWSCGDWTPSSCVNGQQQTRTCSDSNNCGTTSNNQRTETQTCTVIQNLCTVADWSSTLSPADCPATRQQTKTWTKIGNCVNGVNHPATETISCVYNIPTCTDFTYSDWDVCSQSGTQSRSVLSAIPSTCQGGNPILTRTCTPVTCTSNWNCGDWSVCSNNQQTRTCSDSNSCGTTTNKPAETKSCSTTGNIADANGDGRVDTDELISFIDVWLNENATMEDLLSAIDAWLNQS